MKLKNSCYETQKLKVWLNSKTQVVLKLKFFSCDECDETKKTQIVMQLKNSNCDLKKKKTLIVMN